MGVCMCVYSNVSEKLEGRPTNQRAELVVSQILWGHSYNVHVLVQAACRGIEAAIQQGHASLEIRTDSKYTINGTMASSLHMS